MNARILLVDDREVVREGLKFLFSDARLEWQVCGEAANSDEAIKQAVASKPDVIILRSIHARSQRIGSCAHDARSG